MAEINPEIAVQCSANCPEQTFLRDAYNLADLFHAGLSTSREHPEITPELHAQMIAEDMQALMSDGTLCEAYCGLEEGCVMAKRVLGMLIDLGNTKAAPAASQHQNA